MEAKTLNCQSCGAAVGERDLQCPYCGSQLATVACPHCFAMVPVQASHCPRCGFEVRHEAGSATGLACPTCRKPLSATTVGQVTLDQCVTCGGVWIDQRHFEDMAADRAERGQVLGALPGQGPKQAAPLLEVHYRPCPSCGKLMNRTNYGRISGVVLDVCKDHGLWFDRDKLRQVLAFIDAGGLDRSHKLQAEEEAERRRLPVTDLPGGAWTETPPALPGRGGLLGTLVDLLFKL
jgi:Zn-finger nucleic acid-binding protein/RNA polymerase subunit RPABC4/transcription elongation factor Spt4